MLRGRGRGRGNAAPRVVGPQHQGARQGAHHQGQPQAALGHVVDNGGNGVVG
jgi:hypothetical protein